MKIDRNNYEPFFIDYLEGTLDEKLVDDFLEFLQQNPDLKEELSLFNPVSIEPEEFTFIRKDRLYKEKFDLETEFNKAAISNLEGDISASEKADFEKYIHDHPEKEKDIALFNATKLQPDLSVIFKNKNQLYHISSGKTILLWSARIAAVLILALTFYFAMDRYSNPLVQDSQVASVEDKTAEKENKKEADRPTENTVQQEPVKKQEKEVEKESTKPAIREVKKAIPGKKENKGLRENNQGRLEKEDMASARIPVEALPDMNRITASLDVPKAQATLETMYITVFEAPLPEEERFLADIVVEKTGLDKLNLNKITKAGLNLVASISNEKFQYETNDNGKVTEVNYDSRILAFSIPTKNAADGK